MPSAASRINRLTARVRWCDRYRRAVAIAIAMVVSPTLIGELGEVLGTGWPRLHGATWPLLHGVLMSVMLGVVVWWMAEVSLAWLTAVWETECDHLVRGRGLPRAELVRRRK